MAGRDDGAALADQVVEVVHPARGAAVNVEMQDGPHASGMNLELVGRGLVAGAGVGKGHRHGVGGSTVRVRSLILRLKIHSLSYHIFFRINRPVEDDFISCPVTRHR